MTQKDLKLSIKISVDESGLVKLDKSVTNQVNKTKELEAASERLKAAKLKAADAFIHAQDIAARATKQVNEGVISLGLALHNVERATNKQKKALNDLTTAETAYQSEAKKTVKILNEIARLQTTASEKAPTYHFEPNADKSIELSPTKELTPKEAKIQTALQAIYRKRAEETKRYNEEQKALEKQRLADFNLVETKLKEASARRLKIEQDREKAIQANLQASIAKQREINAAHVAQTVRSLTSANEPSRAAELASLRSSIQAKYARSAAEEQVQEDLHKKAIAANLAAYKQQTADSLKELDNKVKLETSIRKFGADSQQTIALKVAMEEQRIKKELATTLARIEREITSGSITSSEARGKVKTATNSATAALINNSKALEDNNKSLERNRQHHQSLAVHLSGVTSHIGKHIGIYRLLNAAINLTEQALLSVPRTLIQLQSSTASLSATFQSAAGAARELAFINEEAQRTGIAVNQLRKSYADFAASMLMAGESAETLRRVFAGVNTIATTLHMTTDAVESTFLALSQAFNKGKIQAEEMVKQLAQRLPGIYNQAATALGMTTKELGEQMKKGLVEAHGNIDKIIQLLATVYGGDAFKKASTGLNAELGRLSTAWTHFTETIGVAAETPMKTFVKNAASVLEYLTKMTSDAGATAKALNAVAAALAAITTATVLSGLASLSGAVVKVAGVLKTLFELVRGHPLIALGSITAGIATDVYLDNKDLEEQQKKLNIIIQKQQELKDIQNKGLLAKAKKPSVDENQEVKDIKKLIDAYDKETARLTQQTGMFFRPIGLAKEDYEKRLKDRKLLVDMLEHTIKEAKNEPTEKFKTSIDIGIDKGAAKGAAKEAAKLAKETYRAAFEEIKASYNETFGDIADASARVDSLYEQNILSISTYFTQKEQLQKTDLYVQQAMIQAEIDLASSKHDKIKIAKLEGELVKINNKASQDAIKLSQEKYNAELKYKNLLESTQISYLNSVNMSAKAARVSFDTQNRERLNSLQTAYVKGEPGAATALEQFGAERHNTLLKASFDEAQRYRDALHSIDDGWKQIGATSSDVLSASLGGFSPLFNLFDNFASKQNELVQKLEDVHAEARRLKDVQIAPNDKDAENKLFKDREINQKQINLLEAESAANRIKLARESFGIVTSMFKEGTKARKIAHVAEMAFNVAEKFGILAKLPLLGAEAMLTQGKGDPYTAFARIAAMGALVAAIIAAVGGSKPSVKDTTMPESTGQGTVYGDKTTESTSITDSLGYLADINLKSYGELKQINANLVATTHSITALVLASSKGLTLNKVNTAQLTAVSPDRNKIISNILTAANFITYGTVPGLIMLALTFIPGVGKAISAVVNFFINGLLGKVTKTITAQGLIASSMAAARIEQGEKAIISQYTTIKKKTEGWFFTSIKIYDVMSKATEASISTFTNIFQYMINIMKGFAGNLTSTEYDKVLLYTFSKIKINLYKQDPAKITEKLKQVLSAELDKYAQYVFGDIYGIYQDLKEGMFTTLTRVTKQAAFTKFSFDKLGITVPTVQTELVAVAEALIGAGSSAEAAADRFKDFQKTVDTFYNNFSTEAKKNLDSLDNFTQSLLTIFAEDVKGAITKAEGPFKSLNEAFFTTLRTTGDVYAAVEAMNKAIDITRAGAQNAVAAILSLDPAIAKLVSTITHPITEQITLLQDTVNNFTTVELIEKLKGEKDINIQKTLVAKSTKLIMEKYNIELNAIKSTKSALKDLGNMVKNLLLGDLSTLDPTEKYQEAEKQYFNLLAQLKSEDAVKASEAASKIGSAAQTYLQEAKSYFSATTEYAAIFKSVTDTLSKLSDINTTGEAAIIAATENLATAAIDQLKGLATIAAKSLEDIIVVAMQKFNDQAASIVPARESEIMTSILNKITAALATTDTKDDTLADRLLQAFKADKANSVSGNLYRTDADIETGLATAAKTKPTTDDFVWDLVKRAYKTDPNLANYLLELDRQKLEADKAEVDAQLVIAKKTTNRTLIENLKKQSKEIDGRIKLLTKQIDPQFKPKAKASGGSASGLTLVGEQGPELLQLPFGSSIMSNPSTNRYINANSKASTDLLQEIKVELVTLNGRMETIERKTRLGAKA